MAYETDEKLKNYLDTNQLYREQMCLAILALDRRFSNLHPRHPRGGPDGGRDIEATDKDGRLVYGAIGFVNQANDSAKQKRTIKIKFKDDLQSALNCSIKPDAFVFFTNVNLVASEKDELIKESKKYGISYCEIFDRERLRISLDSPDGLAARFQYLNISLSEAEQASFFARWGDDIQSIISTGFQRLEHTINRVLFLQEANDPINNFTVSIELDKRYTAEDIGHYRFFCILDLMEPMSSIPSILFGSSDRAKRIRSDDSDVSDEFLLSLPSGIKYGICAGEWEQEPETHENKQDINDKEKYRCRCYQSSIGRNDVEFLSISYSKSSFFRIPPYLSLKDIDEAIFIICMNKSLAQKVQAIHLYSNAYKLREYHLSDFLVDCSEYDPSFPVKFTSEELTDPWVRIRPKDYSIFRMDFFSETPKRLFVHKQIVDSLKIE